jgi:hypothetical protein
MENDLNRGAVLGRRQVRVVTQTGNINIGLPGCFQNRRPGGHFNELSVDGQIYNAHFYQPMLSTIRLPIPGFRCHQYVGFPLRLKGYGGQAGVSKKMTGDIR